MVLSPPNHPEINTLECLTVITRPEEQAEDGERADVDATAGDGREDAANEARQNEDDSVPSAEVHDRVEGLAFLFSETRQLIVVESTLPSLKS
jgi:hypothetical protein